MKIVEMTQFRKSGISKTIARQCAKLIQSAANAREEILAKFDWVRVVDEVGFPLFGVGYRPDGALCRVKIQGSMVDVDPVTLKAASEVVEQVMWVEDVFVLCAHATPGAPARFMRDLAAALPE